MDHSNINGVKKNDKEHNRMKYEVEKFLKDRATNTVHSPHIGCKAGDVIPGDEK